MGVHGPDAAGFTAQGQSRVGVLPGVGDPLPPLDRGGRASVNRAAADPWSVNAACFVGPYGSHRPAEPDSRPRSGESDNADLTGTGDHTR